MLEELLRKGYSKNDVKMVESKTDLKKNIESAINVASANAFVNTT